MSRDYRDLTIEALADDEAAAYREAYQAAVVLLSEQHRRIITQDRTIAALRDELRRYTARQVAPAEAA